MLAAHHDQENLVRSHQNVSTKQQPKTPGAKYPKTPSNFGRNNENAPNAFAGKSTVGAGAKLMAKSTGPRHAMMTPMETHARAPLGNKTTNAKARPGQPVVGADIVKEIETTRMKQNVGQKPKQKSASSQLHKLNLQANGSDDDDVPEPEYAPPRPNPLPYQSDVLPEGGLTFNGLKQNNLFKGYYDHFYNPVDDFGVSRMERMFNDEMQSLLKKTEERNAQELDAFDWSTGDYAANQMLDHPHCNIARKTTPSFNKKPRITTSQKQPPTVSARRAVSVFGTIADKQKRMEQKPASSTCTSRRPLSSIISGTKPANPVVTNPNTAAGHSTGEAASRTTLGYSKGRSASSLVHSHRTSQFSKSQQPTAPLGSRPKESETTIMSARGRPAQSSMLWSPRPQFMSMFEDEDNEDLPQMQSSFLPLDDEEEFELKLTI